MQTNEIYRRYLMADRLSKGATRAGLTVTAIEIRVAAEIFRTSPNYMGFHGYGADVDIRFTESYSATPERREELAVRLLEELPFLQLTRKEGRIQFHAVIAGLKVESFFGEGVCEKVQIGTRTIPAEPAKPEREEPIYEVRCIDPIVAAFSD